jgi:5-methylcytosine-specific restriction endonuclease McrA
MKINRDKVYLKCAGYCAYCGIKLTIKQMHVDHKFPKILSNHLATKDLLGNWIMPDMDTFDNLMPSCRECNNYKGAWSLEEFRRNLKNLLNDRPDYLFKSKTKMQVAINIGSVKLKAWDGLFFFEKLQHCNNI